MTEDMIKVIVDQDPSDTGAYELIYESPKIRDTQDFTKKNELVIEGIRI